MDIGFLKINTENFPSKLLNFVSESRKNKVEKYRNDFDKKISLFSELLIRIMLKNFGENDWKNLKISENKWGKPLIIGNHNYCMSLSHSIDMISCALDVNNKLGIDIEKISFVPAELKDTIFHSNEYSNIYSQEKFFPIWTAKEAFSKYTGNGLSEDFSQLDTTSSTFQKHIVQWKENDFFCSVYADKVNNINIKYYSEKEILKHYD